MEVMEERLFRLLLDLCFDVDVCVGELWWWRCGWLENPSTHAHTHTQ
jgi:hypothetical protein